MDSIATLWLQNERWLLSSWNKAESRSDRIHELNIN